MITGEMLIGARAVRGAGAPFRAVDPATGVTLAPAYGSATPEDLARACALAEAALDGYRAAPLAARADFLDTIAKNILDLGEALILRCMAETGLPRGRLEGERARTVGQLRMFSDAVRTGEILGLRHDPAQPGRMPAPRPDLRLGHVPVGPVAVFGASNFPLAFSVAGGDTASALAAGCPVVVKAHPAHPGTSEWVGRAVQRAVAECGLPEGTFALLFDEGHGIGAALAADPRIAAVGFTGSRAGGTALMRIASARPVPVPVFAEMSSINPVLLFPAALDARAARIGEAFAAALTLGAGQFCTNPGLVLAVDGTGLDAFLATAAAAVAASPAQTMLTPAIHRAYARGVAAWAAHRDVECLARGGGGGGGDGGDGGDDAGGPNQGQAALFATTAAAFRADPALRAEVFGAAALVVRCPDLSVMEAVLGDLEGQLTASLHCEAGDLPAARRLMPLLERKVGRILVGGFGTGVEVASAMVHGGPYPATSDGRSTSVGSLAVARFLRPVSYQDCPDALLPDQVRRAGIPRPA